MLEMLIPIVELWLEGLGFNLCVAPFLNVHVSNIKLEGVCWSWLEVLLQTGILKADNRVAKSDGSDVGWTWLQLMCCALPKHLCP